MCTFIFMFIGCDQSNAFSLIHMFIYKQLWLERQALAIKKVSRRTIS